MYYSTYLEKTQNPYLQCVLLSPLINGVASSKADCFPLVQMLCVPAAITNYSREHGQAALAKLGPVVRQKSPYSQTLISSITMWSREQRCVFHQLRCTGRNSWCMQRPKSPTNWTGCLKVNLIFMALKFIYIYIYMYSTVMLSMFSTASQFDTVKRMGSR